MNYSLVATTRDTICVWDFGISELKQAAGSSYLHGRRKTSELSADIGSSKQGDRASVSMKAAHTADGTSGIIDGISCVSWAASGSSFVVSGKGNVIRQYSKEGESLQDINLGYKGGRASTMDIVAVQHYGPNSKSLFVANNTTRQVRHWDFVKNDYGSECLKHTSDISCMAVSTKRKLVVSATSQGGEIAVYNMLLKTRSDLRSATHRALTCVDISSGLRSQIVVGSEDGLLQLFENTRAGAAPVKTYSHIHAAPLRGIAFHPINNSSIVSVGLDGRIVITDSNNYASGRGGGGGSGAMDIAVGSPLTCLSSCHDPFVIGTGTIDGEALLYDIRSPTNPLWRGSVGAQRAVVSIGLSQGEAVEKGDLSQPFQRSEDTAPNQWGSRATSRSVSVHGGHASSDEDATDIFGVDSRQAASSRISTAGNARDNNMPPPAATGGISRRTSRFLPPQHPSIGRYRSALAEYQSNQPAKSSAPKARPKNPYSPVVPVKRPLPEDDGLFADENMSIMRDDRSFMDLLSPTKLESTAYESKSAVIQSSRRDIISSLSRASGTAALEVESRVRQSLPPVDTRSAVQSTGNIGAGRHSSFSRTDYERDFAKPQPKEPFERSMAAASESLEPSPIAQPLQPDRRHYGSRSHDVGDSMMEMFTPERKKSRVTAPVAGSFSFVHGDPSSSIPRDIVSQLLSKHSTPLDVEPRHRLPAEGKNAKSLTSVSASACNFASRLASAELREPAAKSGPRLDDWPDQEKPASSCEPPAAAGFKSPNRLSIGKPVRHSPAKHRSSQLFEKPAKAPAPTPTPKAVFAVQTETALLPDTATAAARVLAASAAGLGSISSSVLQNLLSDALAPLREQISGEIRNLHLDMIRQNFVYQEQIDALRQECNEAKVLRQEMEQLRRENEQLKRYVPFYNFVEDGDARPAKPNNDRVPDATRPG
ncbi:hypothetical protein LPJ66_002384 [Kickxella alabastrina]|uniref:Uncharacterized protein n=1 Tax=Kickxella alabastrina TaxID=61397 RepID=A0ACC1IQJ4_9FUNG|nr:hypothetical protein LPJ66_002384 [Kickxella alabastrina]